MTDRWTLPRQAVLDWMAALQKEGFILYILSNNKHHHRVKAFAEAVAMLKEIGFESIYYYRGRKAQQCKLA